MRRILQAVFFVVIEVVGAISCTKPELNPSKKILNVAVDDEVRTLDPALTNDEYSHVPMGQIYQPLYQYSYLKRPYEVEPLLTESIPKVSKDQLTYTFHLRPNVFFHDDPAFGGKPRRLVAEDVVYSLRRLVDPKVKSPNRWLLDGVREITARDDRTVVIRLIRPYRQLIHALAMIPSAIVAREVVDRYGVEFVNHPVGTGPFVFKEWIRGQRIVLEKNPKYWGEIWEGHRLPLVDGVVLSIFVETQPRWLNFLKGNLDYASVPKEALEQIFDLEMTARPEYAKKGITVSRTPMLDVLYFFFNMTDPVLGKNRFLRQAISSAINRKEKQELFYKNRSIVAQGPIPPDLFGYDPKLKDPNGYDLARAKILMAEAIKEYQRQGGKGKIPPLVYDVLNNATDRQITEAIVHDLSQIGVKVETRIVTWPQFLERKAKNQVQFGFQSWFADYPDPENFLQLFYGKNASPGPNASNFRNARYDTLYERMRNMSDGPEREEIIRQMVSLLHEEVPWIFFLHRSKLMAQQGWLKNFKYHALDKAPLKYLDVDLKAKTQTLPKL